MDDRVLIEVVHCSHDAILEFLFGCHTDVAQDGSRELGKEALDEIEPRAVLGSEGEFEAAGGLDRGQGAARRPTAEAPPSGPDRPRREA